MGFDVEKFRKSDLIPRTAKVKVDGMKSLFKKGEEPVWEVRGLSGVELQKALDAKSRNEFAGELAAKIEGGNASDIASALRKRLGLGDDTPGETIKRLEMLVYGSVDPEITLADAVKINQCFPIEFLILTHKISDLTGLGFDYAKPKAALPKTAN